MYKYIRALGSYANNRRALESIDLSSVLLKTIIPQLASLKILILNDFYNSYETVNLFDYYGEVFNYDGTVDDWLTTKDGTILNHTTDMLPNRKLYATVFRPYEVGLEIGGGNLSLSADRQTGLTQHNAVDIRLYRSDTKDMDYNKIQSHTLYSLNGLMIRATSSSAGVFLVDGAKHFRVYKNMFLQGINFNLISKLTQTQIKESQLNIVESSGAPTIEINVGQDISDKLVWLVVGGHLYFNDICQPNSDSTVLFQLNKANLEEKLFTSRERLNFEHVLSKETTLIPQSRYYDKSFLTTLLTDVSSFLIVFDNPNLSINLTELMRRPYHSVMVSERKPSLPVMLSNGLIGAYLPFRAPQGYTLSLDEVYTRNFEYKTIGAAPNKDFYHDTIGTYKPVKYLNGYELEIATLIYDKNIEEQQPSSS